MYLFCFLLNQSFFIQANKTNYQWIDGLIREIIWNLLLNKFFLNQMNQKKTKKLNNLLNKYCINFFFVTIFMNYYFINIKNKHKNIYNYFYNFINIYKNKNTFNKLVHIKLKRMIKDLLHGITFIIYFFNITFIDNFIY